MEQAESLDPKVAFGPVVGNRWIQLIAGVVAMIVISNFQYAFTLFTPGLKESFPTVPYKDIALIFTLFILFETWPVPVAGHFIDKFGIRKLMLVGATCIHRSQRGLGASLSAGIEISHDDAEHLTGEPRLALGNRRVHAQLAIGIGQIPVPPRHGRKAGAAAADESRAFGRDDSLLEGPVRKASLKCVGSLLSNVFERIGQHRFDDPARKNQRETKFAALEGVAAVGERLLEDGPKLRVVHEFEFARSRRRAGRGRVIIHA